MVRVYWMAGSTTKELVRVLRVMLVELWDIP